MVAFTATQILNIDGGITGDLAGKLYPNGIPTHPENELARANQGAEVDQVVFAYSDVTTNT